MLFLEAVQRSSFRAGSFVLVLFLAVLLSARPAWAQGEEAEEDSLALGEWRVGMAGKLAGSQAAYRNWAEGGISTLALTSSLSGRAEQVNERWTQRYDLRLAFGLIKQDSLEVRKADDVIRLGGNYQYQGAGFFRTFNPTVAFQARSQFAAGYNYDQVPPGLEGRSLPVKVSDFMAPGVFTQSLGLTYDPSGWFTQRLGVALKETAVAINRLRPVYGLRLDQQVRIEAGLESRTEVDREIVKNVRYQSTLGLFAAFNQTSELPDLSWENLIAMQVNSWLGVNFEFTTLYDADISDRLQFKEVLSVGVTVTFI